MLPGDLQEPRTAGVSSTTAVADLGGIDILVNNAAHQATFKEIDDISDEEWELTFRVNIHAMFYLTKAAVPHMKPGSSIINTASINSDAPNPTLLAYATTKGAIHNFTAGLAQMLAEKGIRVNAVAPGPIWTPLIPSTMPPETVAKFGSNVPMKRPGQPAELATAYVMLADPLSSYVSGATLRSLADDRSCDGFRRRLHNSSRRVIPISIEKRLVVADHQQCAVVGAKACLDRLDRLDVEMVGRLVEDQQLRRPGAAQRRRRGRRAAPVRRSGSTRSAGRHRRGT